jgi:hypothetical protein
MSASQIILGVLRRSPRAREDDRELLVSYYQECGANLSDQQQAVILKQVSPSSIIRARARHQNEGRWFPPTEARPNKGRRSKGGQS